MTILNYSNPVGVITAPASLGVGIMCSAFIGPVVQAWFAYRVLKFSGSFYIPVACWFLSALRCASTISVAIEALQGGEVRAFEETYRWLLIFILAVGAAVDILIAASLCYYFRKHSRAGGVFAKTMNQLMIWTIETGLLTSVTAVSMLVCFLTMQDNYVWIAIFTFLAKLFSNTFLAALNARSDKRPETALIEKSHLNKSNMSISSFGSPSTYSTPFTTPARSLASPRRTYAPLRKPSLTIQMSYSTDVSYEERTIYDRPVSERWLLSTSPRLPDSPISPTGIAY
ncbi:hypothetical protein HWV62_5600 [Athelia sp. TMB]|nr:hypothetical protein HWV62_5600 [Athelia sp. TMB]